MVLVFDTLLLGLIEQWKHIACILVSLEGTPDLPIAIVVVTMWDLLGGSWSR